ncbi:MAG: transporter substrate-binding domain-containing protein [Desulfobacteraceae bacterium]|nr:transporter substrate-binding domain-containing protein [Desulfobacteraceae bacterium]
MKISYENNRLYQFTRILCTLFAVLSILGCNQDLVKLKPRVKLKFNTQDFSPFSYENNGIASGPGSDIIREICTEARFDCKITFKNWAVAQQEVKTGKADGLFVIGWNAARTKWLYYTEPMIKAEYGFFTRKNSAFRYKELSNLTGATIVTSGPSNTSKTLKRVRAQLNNQFSILIYPNYQSAFKKISQDTTINAIYSDKDSGKSYIARLGLRNLEYAGKHKDLYYYAGISKKLDRQVVDRFNAAFRKLQNKGTIREILGRYAMSAIAADSCSTALRRTPAIVPESNILHIQNEVCSRLYTWDEFPNLFCEYDKRFEFQKNGTTFDHGVRLEWKNTLPGQALTWKDALSHIKQLNEIKASGYSDWRMPTVEELYSLICYSNPKSNYFLKRILKSSNLPLWSIDRVKMTNNVWSADLFNAMLAPAHRNEKFTVLAVRTADAHRR